MNSFKELPALPFEILSKEFTPDQAADRLKESDKLSVLLQAFSRFVPKVIIVVGLLIVLIKLIGHSSLFSIATTLVAGLLLLAITQVLFNYVLKRADSEFKESTLRKARLLSFAEAADWSYLNSWKEPRLKGAPAVMTNRLWLQETLTNSSEDPQVIISNAILNIQTHNNHLIFSSVIAIKLPTKVQQLYLESLINTEWQFKNLSGKEYKELKQLELEGDFQKYFRLYCLPGQEQQALYIFSPELMALMIDTGQQFSAELAGSWLFLFHGDSFNFSEQQMRDLARIIDLIGGEFEDNTENMQPE